MLNLNEEIKDAKVIGISGHVRPDGDCIGSVMGLYLYLKKTKPDVEVHVFLEPIEDVFLCIKDTELIEDASTFSGKCDVFFAIDCGKERLGAAERLFDEAKLTVNIDHHVSNPGTGMYNYIVPDASSASELVYDLLNKDDLDKDIAMALYIGIIHDTGVLQYSNTSAKTLNTVGNLIRFGFDFPHIIEETFYEKTLLQTKLLGKVLTECGLFLDGKVAAGYIDRKTMDEVNAQPYDLDGIVNQLRNIRGVDTAVFMYQTPDLFCKVSLRSNGVTDVSKIVSKFGGGGHVRAAGCTMEGSYEENIQKLVAEIEAQYRDKQID